jgi:anti-sigma factor RsiW
MTDEQQLKLQAFLDGELTENEAREVASWLARDSEAKALHTELKNTRRAIKDSEPSVKLPESREFYWSKIQREIERLEPIAEKPAKVSPLIWWRRVLMPVSALAVFVIAGLIAFYQFIPHGAGPLMETDVASANADGFTYRDYAKGVTLVWLPFPAEKEVAQNRSATTIQ